MRRLRLRHRGVLIGVGCLVALAVRGLPARAERQYIPIPEVIVDPNEGTTVGILGVLLMSDDETKSVSSILAPDVRYNDSFGVYPTLRYFGYPDPQTQFSIIAGKGTKRARMRRWSTAATSMFDGWLDLFAHGQHEEDPFERFYGFGNHTPEQQRDQLRVDDQRRQCVRRAQCLWTVASVTGGALARGAHRARRGELIATAARSVLRVLQRQRRRRRHHRRPALRADLRYARHRTTFPPKASCRPRGSSP